ncbi:MAG: hypothetical protein AAF604_19020 [Acidobacteriota bacterium]
MRYLAAGLLALLACSPPAGPRWQWQDTIKVGPERLPTRVELQRDAAGRWIEQRRALRGEVLSQRPAPQPPSPRGSEIRQAIATVRGHADLTPTDHLGGGFRFQDRPCPALHRCLEIFRFEDRAGAPSERWIVDLDTRRVLEP